MTRTNLIQILITASSAVAFSAVADAQTRTVPRGGSVVIGQAVPRPAPSPGPRGGGPVVSGPRGGVPFRPYYNSRPYYRRPYYPVRSGFSIGVFAGYPLGYYPYPYPYSYAASGYYAPPPTTYVVQAPPAVPLGSLRILGASPDAQVFADGYYVGIVDDFDGAYQRLNLAAGPHRIEIRVPGVAPIEFDVRLEPGQTITYRAELQ